MSDNPRLTLPPGGGLPMSEPALEESVLNHLQHTQGKHPSAATVLDQFLSTSRAARDRMFDRWTRTWKRYTRERPKRVYYLSMEYLLGRLLEDGLSSLGIHEEMREALGAMGIDFEQVVDQELDAGLGNGGLGRLAACFLDSMATLGIAGMGYGIRYEYGIFRQDIVAGAQVERPDNWLRFGNPWEIARPERLYTVHFGGRVIKYTGSDGRIVHEWVDAQDVYAMAYDVPVPGFRNGVVNTLRLWSAKATREFALDYFNRGDYIRAVEEKSDTENITRVLYPNDNLLVGKELRLKQEYFLVSATLQDALRRHLTLNPDLDSLPDQAVFQLNDTHPALAIAEMMRLLTDERGLAWEQAWELTQRCFAYTNHTILPEALERWPVWLMERVLPRHLELVYEINQRFLGEVSRRYPGDVGRLSRMSLIEEGPEKKVRMASLAIVGSRKVNGVSALHSRLLREQIFRDYDEMYPGKFINVTNGVTQRRWLLKCNPELSALISSRIGTGWYTDLDELARLAPFADDPALQSEWRAVKRQRKLALAEALTEQFGVRIDPEHMIDAHVKRFHEYKRQLLNIVHVVSLYLRLRANPSADTVPRTFVFSGKAAPGYDMAKRILHLINSVASTLDGDFRVRDRLRVVFVPNYGVSIAELIIPATDVSEQISTAGMEASGTGNMKFALNGALTIGTLDGANIEIKDAVGEENLFLFGLDAEGVLACRRSGYSPVALYQSDPELRAALDAIASGLFSPDEPARFRPVVDALLRGGDPYLVLADFRSYAACQRTVEATYREPAAWTRRSILNVARMGMFSSDRSIRTYAREIWEVGA
ncbi:MAG: glycogen/starch/alpha-glucan phosphorylase [Sorangiineae bacterium]|nr:glycogen/starch/alpha-glucan phosphorylase [Polyangiaceae bacterium]MEB2324173.1 glycogen/starch/alpha-glucan phosphorylase [Sorangiineae bacterium]